MKSICAMRFRAVNGCQFRYVYGDADISALDANLTDGMLTVAAWYTSHDRPLVLKGSADPGDDIRLVFRLWRIELYVNDEIMDEEWPFGDARFTDGTLAECHVEILFENVPEREEAPDFVGSFTGAAEGWYPGSGVFVGDCMPYTFGDRYHVLYLKDRHHHGSKWGKGAHQWAHVSSTDLIHWDIHPMAVEIDDPAEGSICTGSWIYENGIHQLYYTVRMADDSSAPIRRSLSTDGWHYKKDTGFSFTLSDAYTGSSARDPKVVRAADGQMHMFVTTTEVTSGKGCLVHLTSADGDKWEERGTVYISPDANEPECPDYFSVNGWYYLVFSHYGRAQYLVSDKPFSDWRVPSDPYIPCSSVPKAAVWHNRIIFTGFVGHNGYGGHMTFMEAAAGENGELCYFPVKEMQIT